MKIYVKIFCISIFSLFWILKHFIRCVAFTRIAVSNTASDDITNYVTHIQFKRTYHILVLILQSKLMKNLALMAGFNTI